MVLSRARQAARPLVTRLAAFGWGSVDQLLSSASNFALSVVAGQLLGPTGLGVVFVGFSSYLIALGFLRALVLQPLVVTSTAYGADGRRTATRHAVTACAAGALASSAIVLVIGLLIPGDVGHGLRLFAPWIAPAILQDLCRSVLFRDGRGATATGNDAVWVLTMVLTLPLVLWSRSDVAVVSWWGFGGLIAAVTGFVQASLRLGPVGASWAWWRGGASLSIWLAVESAVVYGGAQGAVFILAAVLGPGDLGGLRAAETLFVPTSFLKPAMELPGLAAMSRAVERGTKGATALATGMSGAAVTITLLYLLVVAAAGKGLLERIFGHAFASYDSLLLPFGAGQACAALAVGAVILLKAQRRGRALVACGAVGAVVALIVAPLLGWLSGVDGAAWGLAGASGAASAVSILLATGLGRRRGIAAG